MRHRKIREESGVLVPTSGEHYCDSSGENGSQAASWHTVSQILISANPSPSRLSYGPATGTLRQTDLCLHLHLASGFLSWCCGPNADLVQSLNCMADLCWTLRVRGVCLSWMNKRQTCCQFPLTKFLSGNQTCLVHPECGCGCILEFPLRLVRKHLTGTRFSSESNYRGGSVCINLTLGLSEAVGAYVYTHTYHIFSSNSRSSSSRRSLTTHL